MRHVAVTAEHNAGESSYAEELAPMVAELEQRGIAVTSAKRLAGVPELPTMIEAGTKDPMPTQWWGMSGPKGLPPAIVSRLNSEIGRIVALPDVKLRYNDLGIVPMHSTPERMLEVVRSEIPQMAKILAAIGIKQE